LNCNRADANQRDHQTIAPTEIQRLRWGRFCAYFQTAYPTLMSPSMVWWIERQPNLHEQTNRQNNGETRDDPSEPYHLCGLTAALFLVLINSGMKCLSCGAATPLTERNTAFDISPSSAGAQLIADLPVNHPFGARAIDATEAGGAR